MEFEDFWENSKKYFKTKVELESISKTIFVAQFDQNGGLIVVTPQSTNLPRDVNKSDFRNVFEKMKKLRRKHVDLYRPALYQRITRNSSYILPIIKYVLTEGGKQTTLQKNKYVTH